MKTRRNVLVGRADELIAEGRALESHARDSELGYWVPNEPFTKWRVSCQILGRAMGDADGPWHDILNGEKSGRWSDVEEMIGVLLAIKEAIVSGMLVRVEDLVLAEAFDSLLEQADHLLKEGYILAGGVLGRAVLEEHLRNWCDREGCLPNKSRPTLNDYNTALYKAKHLDKLAMKQVEALIAIGNHAAHNQPDLKREDVERLLRDVRDFLVKHGPDKLTSGDEKE